MMLEAQQIIYDLKYTQDTYSDAQIISLIERLCKKIRDMEQGKYDELRKKRVIVMPCEIGEPIYVVVMKKDSRTRQGYAIITRRVKLNADNLYKACQNYGKWVFADYESAKAEEIRIRNMTREEKDAHYRSRAG